jgi:hypothetical protein
MLNDEPCEKLNQMGEVFLPLDKETFNFQLQTKKETIKELDLTSWIYAYSRGQFMTSTEKKNKHSQLLLEGKSYIN